VSKICARGINKALAHFLRKTLGMLSGPSEVVGFNFLRVEQTASGVKVIESR